MAETVFAGLFAAAALYGIFIEGTQNWQALWTSAAYLLFGATLWQARCKESSDIHTDWYRASEPTLLALGSAAPKRSSYLAGTE